ncbi:MAG: secretin N-terminal domain-containing protein [Planctomycetia bacterium]|nr:secretin N-terminal domain-containing protein [Planctomycetia bacterium]
MKRMKIAEMIIANERSRWSAVIGVWCVVAVLAFVLFLSGTLVRGQSSGPQSFSPVTKKVEDLEKWVTALFGGKLVALTEPVRAENPLATAPLAQKGYRFTGKSRDRNETVRTCDLLFQFGEQKVLLSGDAELVRQMLILLQSMDKPLPPPGNVRRFISIRQADTRKLDKVLQWDRTIRTPEEHSGTGQGQEESGIRDAAFRGESGEGQITQTAWQGEGAADLGALGDAFGEMVGPGGSRNVGVVQDYIPQVLPDLDVVIIDAPEAEYKRIENMIREIEELAKLAEPEIEVYSLAHVNCVMLSGILSQLHREMFTTKQGRILLYAMQNPNAILLVGWGQAYTAMKELIQTFDQPIEEGAGLMKVIPLAHASATEMALQLTNCFPLPQPVTGGLAPRIRVFPDARTNSLVVHAAPNDMEQVMKLVGELDVNKSGPRLRVQTFPLKNLLAEDLRRTLMNAILPSVQGTQDGTAAKFPILEFLSVDAESQKLIESGIMTDVQVVADAANNQLIVTAPEDCMELLAKLIEILDVAPAKAQIKIFRIMFGDATGMVRTLQSLLPVGGVNMPSLPVAEGEESFVPLRLAVDSRTNCIIAAAAPRDLKIVEALILSLDRKDVMERKEVVIPLRNVQALSIAKAIDNYLSRKQDLDIASEAMSVYQMFESQVIVVPESITNSLIISATPRYLDEIVKLVESFDNDPPQVVIQVLIAEVVLGNHEEFGIEAGLQDSVAFDRSIVTETTNGVNSATGVPGYDLLGTNKQGNNMLAGNSETVAGQVLNELGMGRASSDLNYGGLVLSASSRSVQVTLRALQQRNRLQILSRPQITAMDNQQAFILVGQRVPRVEQANMTTYGVSSSVADANVGLILLVTPRISKEGRVIMEIGAEKSSLAGEDDAIPVFTSGDQVIKSPSIDTIQAMTAVSAMDGETVMLGGLITTSKQKTSRGVPWFSDIPGVGWLFRYDKEVEERKELLIVMTPRIVRKSDDLEKIKRMEAAKMSWCLADAMAINGNMGLFDPLSGLGGQSRQQQTQFLPVLEMDQMNEQQLTSEYSKELELPVETGVAPAVGGQETLPDDILRESEIMNEEPTESESAGTP